MNTYVVGHKNPDTDSVVSAIAYSRLENYLPAISGKPNKETTYVLERFGFQIPERISEGEKKVILVDHNSPEEMATEVKSSEIVGILDHHKLSGPFTDEPIPVRIETVGSTATLIAKKYFENNITPNAEMCGILISGVLSDTLKFTSPTTTEEDKTIVERLNTIANIDIEVLAKEMFAAKSDISDISTEELLGKDYKVFDMSGRKVGFGVWETVQPQAVLDRLSEIIVVLGEKKKKEGLDYAYFAVVDILNNSSELVLSSSYEEEVAKEVFRGSISDNLMHLPGVLSRKKQLVPPLEGYFSKYKINV